MLARGIALVITLGSASLGLATEQVPQQLGELMLGRPPPKDYIFGESEAVAAQAYYVQKGAIPKMWLAVAPGMPNVVELATITTYKGRAAQVVFALRPDVKFEVVHRNFETRFGKGQKANVRTPPIAKAKDCPPLYLMQHWSSGDRMLTVMWSKFSGVHVVLRTDLAREMDRDSEPDHPPCVEF
jgi:hypothetical protein